MSRFDSNFNNHTFGLGYLPRPIMTRNDMLIGTGKNSYTPLPTFKPLPDERIEVIIPPTGLNGGVLPNLDEVSESADLTAHKKMMYWSLAAAGLVGIYLYKRK
jgi:hypothetical protein